MYRYQLLIWVCILLIAIGATTVANEEAMSLFAEGVKARNAGEVETALGTFKRVTRLVPDFADAHYHLGLVYYQKEEFQNAISAFTRTLELLPRDIDALIKLGLAAHKAGDADPTDPRTQRAFYERAIDAYQAALAIRPHNVEALNNLGLAYQAFGRFEDAIAAYEEGLTLSPDQPQLRANLATASDLQAGMYSLAAYRHYQVGARAKRAGRPAAAIAAWTQAIAESPQYLKAYRQLADLYVKRGESALAIQTYLSAIRAVSENERSRPADIADIFYNLGNAYLSTQQLAAAVSAYEQAVDITPERVSAWANMGTALLEMERLDAAVMACQSALKAWRTGRALGKGSRVSASGLRRIELTLKTAQEIKAGEYTLEAYRLWRQGVSAGNRGDISTALQLWEQAVALSPRYTPASENLMWTYFSLQRFDAAIRAGEHLQTIRPSAAVAQVLRFAHELKAGKYPYEAYQLWEQGRRASAAGDLAGAVALLSQAIEAGPTFAAAYNTLAWLYADTLGTNLVEAERLARRARELAPEATYIYDTLGWVLYKQGRYGEALDVFEEALARAPNTAEYLYHGSLAALKTGQTAQALKYLTQAVAVDTRYIEKANAQSEFDAIRFTPAFRAIVP